MDLTTRRLPFAAVPLRALIVLALIVVLAAAALLVAVGRSIACPPFGPAAQWLPRIVDRRRHRRARRPDSASRLLIGGAEEDSGPGSSPDGTLVAFYRMLPDGSHLMVAKRRRIGRTGSSRPRSTIRIGSSGLRQPADRRHQPGRGRPSRS